MLETNMKNQSLQEKSYEGASKEDGILKSTKQKMVTDVKQSRRFSKAVEAGKERQAAGEKREVDRKW